MPIDREKLVEEMLQAAEQARASDPLGATKRDAMSAALAVAEAAIRADERKLCRYDVSTIGCLKDASQAIATAISAEPESWHETADFDGAASAVLRVAAAAIRAREEGA